MMDDPDSYDMERDEGRKARLEGVPIINCPYEDGFRRVAWLEGWDEQGAIGASN